MMKKLVFFVLLSFLLGFAIAVVSYAWFYSAVFEKRELEISLTSKIVMPYAYLKLLRADKQDDAIRVIEAELEAGLLGLSFMNLKTMHPDTLKALQIIKIYLQNNPLKYTNQEIKGKIETFLAGLPDKNKTNENKSEHGISGRLEPYFNIESRKVSRVILKSEESDYFVMIIKQLDKKDELMIFYGVNSVDTDKYNIDVRDVISVSYNEKDKTTITRSERIIISFGYEEVVMINQKKYNGRDAAAALKKYAGKQ